MTEMVCIMCGRTIRSSHGKSNYSRHVASCLRLTPEQRAEKSKAAARRSDLEKERERVDEAERFMSRG